MPKYDDKTSKWYLVIINEPFNLFASILHNKHKTLIINLLRDFLDSLSNTKLEEVEEIVEEEFKIH